MGGLWGPWACALPCPAPALPCPALPCPAPPRPAPPRPALPCPKSGPEPVIVTTDLSLMKWRLKTLTNENLNILIDAHHFYCLKYLSTSIYKHFTWLHSPHSIHPSSIAKFLRHRPCRSLSLPPSLPRSLPPSLPPFLPPSYALSSSSDTGAALEGTYSPLRSVTPSSGWCWWGRSAPPWGRPSSVSPVSTAPPFSPPPSPLPLLPLAAPPVLPKSQTNCSPQVVCSN